MARTPPKRTLDEVGAPASRFRVIWLAADVTREFLMFRGREKRTYGLLHKSGTFISDTNGPVTCNDWGRAVQLANYHACDFIIIYHKEAIKHRYHTPNGAETWERAIPMPDEATAHELASMVDSFKGADEHGRSRTSLIRAKERKRKRESKQ